MKSTEGDESFPDNVIVSRGAENMTVKTQMMKWQLKQSVSEELMASSVYRQRAIKADDAGDSLTAELYDRVAMDEDEHFNLFMKRLEELGERDLKARIESAASPVNVGDVKMYRDLSKVIGFSDRR